MPPGNGSGPPNGGAKLLGGSGTFPLILAHLGGPHPRTKLPASRVSFSDLLCELAQANPASGHMPPVGGLFDRTTLPPPPPSRSGKAGRTQR
jgi:hypothetical protein